jgi:hypothetical protein
VGVEYKDESSEASEELAFEAYREEMLMRKYAQLMKGFVYE